MAYGCHGIVVAKKQSSEQCKMWRVYFLVVNNAGDSSLVGTLNKSVIASTSIGNEASWDVDVNVDDGLDKMEVLVKGHAADIIRWDADLRFAIVGELGG
jgi:hypothetical protein